MVSFEVGGVHLGCETRPDLFSPKDLDKGSRLLLEQLETIDYEKALDWGCGWGAMTLWLGAKRSEAKIIGLDSDIGAVKVAQSNVERNNLKNVEIIASYGYEDIAVGEFNLIISNPPTHRGREVVETMVRESRDKLVGDGRLVIVVEARLKPWVLRTMSDTFGVCDVLARTNKHVVISATR
jgi:16S rRNA G1207 methylase RsmC